MLNKLWTIMRWFLLGSLIMSILIVTAGFFMPCEDRDGECTICGRLIYEKKCELLSEPVTFTRLTVFSRFYKKAGLPDHEHQWLYLGGVTHTNLWGIPSRVEIERSDPLLLVPDWYLIEIMQRLEKRNAQIELLRGINADHEEFRADVRSHIYEAWPKNPDKFLEWWETWMVELEGKVYCEVLPGPFWEYRAEQAKSAVQDEDAVMSE